MLFPHIRRIFLRIVLVLCLCVFAIVAPDAQDEQRTEVTFFDVGYADAILVGVTGGKQYLIDAGESVLDSLKDRGVDTLEAVVITHADHNHFLGLDDLLGNIVIKEVIINSLEGPEEYTQLLESLSQLGIPVSVFDDGQQILPLAEKAVLQIFCHIDPQSSRNDNSIQSFIKDEESSLWLTSDIGQARQDYYLSRYPQLKMADALQVPHHGDNISETMKELFLARPAIVSTGPNQWNLPDLNLLNKWRAPLYRTDYNGNIKLIADIDGWLVNKEKM